MSLKHIRPLHAGDTIRARWLEDLVSQVNRNTRLLATLQDQFMSGDANTFQRPWVPQSGGGGSMPTSLTFAESTRGYVAVTITDSTGDTHTVNIATSITMTASNAGTSYQWTFTYASG